MSYFAVVALQERELPVGQKRERETIMARHVKLRLDESPILPFDGSCRVPLYLLVDIGIAKPSNKNNRGRGRGQLVNAKKGGG